jgi:hypothetical protein
MSSFPFFWVAAFFIRGLLNKPLAFLGLPLFFIGGLLNKPLYIFQGCLIFHHRPFE